MYKYTNKQTPAIVNYKRSAWVRYEGGLKCLKVYFGALFILISTYASEKIVTNYSCSRI